MSRQHPLAEVSLAGPVYNPAVHAKDGNSQCSACKRHFRSFVSLRKHVEASSCPQYAALHQLSQDRTSTEPALTAAKDQPDIMNLAAKDPEALAVYQGWHPSTPCCLCGQKVGGNKGVKQHLNRQHTEFMNKVAKAIQGKLRAFKNMLDKNVPCRYCGTRVDAPSRLRRVP